MSKNNHVQHNYVQHLRALEVGLSRHFAHEWLFINGCSIHVDDVVETLQRHAAHIERVAAAHAAWLEASAFALDELDHEIGPLLDGLERFLGEELGADSREVRELGFEQHAWVEKHDPDEEGGESN